MVFRHILLTVVTWCAVLASLGSVPEVHADVACAARAVPGASVVCVCNATYCDTVTREPPPPGGFVAYTSSEAGLRFQKSYGKLCKVQGDSVEVPERLVVDIGQQFQAVSGFGAAVTDAAALVWASLGQPARDHFIQSYFGPSGIEYSMVRVPIGGSDFSTHAYAYNEHPVRDTRLTNFTLAPEDYEFKIPLIRAAQLACGGEPLLVLGSLWSPPRWMKDADTYSAGFLRQEFYQTLADYFYKFIESYAAAKIPVWGVTTTNEPLGKIYSSGTTANINRLEWKVKDLGTWIANNLGPTLRNSSFKDVKILVGDDQRFTVPLWLNVLIQDTAAAAPYIDGLAVHFYFDGLTPASQLSQALADYPDTFLLYTEACIAGPGDEAVSLGNWTRAETYAENIIENLNHAAIGWLDWNMCLDETGGPTYIHNNVDSPVIVNTTAQEFYKQPMFYALGHAAKWIERGSRRVRVDAVTSTLQHVAFVTPRKTLVLLVLNKYEAREVEVQVCGEVASLTLDAKSITTVELPYTGAC